MYFFTLTYNHNKLIILKNIVFIVLVCVSTSLLEGCVAQMILSEADELASEGQLEEALIRYKEALLTRPDWPKAEDGISKVRDVLELHLSQTLKTSFIYSDWEQACKTSQRLVKLNSKALHEQAYLEELRLRFEKELRPPLRWRKLKEILEALKLCELEGVKETYEGMITQIRLVISLQIEQWIHTHHFQEGFQFLKQIKKEGIPIEIMDLKRHLLQKSIKRWNLKKQEASTKKYWGEVWVYDVFIESFKHTLHKMSVLSDQDRSNREHKKVSTQENSTAQHVIQRALKTPFSQITLHADSRFIKSDTPLSSILQDDVINEFGMKFSYIQTPQFESEYHQKIQKKMKRKLKKSLKKKRNKSSKEDPKREDPKREDPKRDVNIEKKGLKDTQFIRKQTQHKKNNIQENKLVKLLPPAQLISSSLISSSKTNPSSIYPTTQLTVSIYSETECNKSKEKGVRERRYVERSIESPDPKWRAAIKRVESQQVVFESTQSELEDLNIALEKARSRLKEFLEFELKPKETSLLQATREAKEKREIHTEIRQLVNQYKSNQIKYEFDQKMRKNARARLKELKHQQHRLRDLYRSWQRLLNQYVPTILQQLSPLITYQYVLSKNTTDHLRQHSPIWRALQQEQKTLKERLGDLLVPPVNQAHLSELVTQLKQEELSDRKHSQVLYLLQTEIEEVRSKRKSFDVEIVRLQEYVRRTELSLKTAEQELGRLERETRGLKKTTQQDVYAVFRYPVKEWTLRCVIKWYLKMTRSESQREWELEWSERAQVRDISHLAYAKHRIKTNTLHFSEDEDDLIRRANKQLIQKLKAWIKDQYSSHLKEAYVYSQHPSISNNIGEYTDILARLTLINPSIYSAHLISHLAKHKTYYGVDRVDHLFSSSIEISENIKSQIASKLLREDP